MYPLKHTAEQYRKVIEVCEHAKSADAPDYFEWAQEAFLELEPSLTIAALAEKFKRLGNSLDRLRQIIADLYELRDRTQREESLARKGRVN